ncbi:MAG: response regulator, partial [Steroidobacteraceae bacterium]
LHVRPDEDRSSKASSSDPLQTVELPRLDDTNVLLVDDDVDGCELVSSVLIARGARVRCVTSGPEGLQVMAQEHFDVVLSDVGMPDMNGFEFMRALRKAEEGRSKMTPAIAVTAYAGTADRQRALLSGYQMHIAKPIETAELIAAIASLKPLKRM